MENNSLNNTGAAGAPQTAGGVPVPDADAVIVRPASVNRVQTLQGAPANPAVQSAVTAPAAQEDNKKKKPGMKTGLKIAIGIPCAIAAILIAALSGVYFTAQSKYSNGDFDSAREVLATLDFLQPFRQMAVECDYAEAEALMEAGEYYKAYNIYLELTGYRNADDKAKAALYEFAQLVLENGNYEKAAELFEELGKFRKSKDFLLEAKYLWADELAHEDGGAEKARDIFEELGDYEDSEHRVIECEYWMAIDLYYAGKYRKAMDILEKHIDYDEAIQVYYLLCVHGIYFEEGTTIAEVRELYELLAPYADDYEDVEDIMDSPLFSILRLIGAKWQCESMVIDCPGDKATSDYAINHYNIKWRIANGECWWDWTDDTMFIASDSGIWFIITGFSSYDELHPQKMYIKSPDGEMYTFELVEVYD